MHPDTMYLNSRIYKDHYATKRPSHQRETLIQTVHTLRQTFQTDTISIALERYRSQFTKLSNIIQDP